MALSTCFASPHVSFKTGNWRQGVRCHQHGLLFDQWVTVAGQSKSSEPLMGQHNSGARATLRNGWGFLGGQRITLRSKTWRILHSNRRFKIHSSWQVGSQLASTAFTFGTAAVLPFYTLMVVAPKAELTRKTVGSSVPYVILGILYAYLLYQSWTPETIRLMFASKYWLPELSGIAKMFANEMTLASAWIHLLVVDLFAARQIYHDGLENEIETRHSVSLCLLFCPIGILAHVITKALSKHST